MRFVGKHIKLCSSAQFSTLKAIGFKPWKLGQQYDVNVKLPIFYDCFLNIYIYIYLYIFTHTHEYMFPDNWKDE